MFEKENISGIEFLTAYLKSGKEIENLYQLYVTTILVPGDLNTELCEDKIKDDELKKELIAEGTYYPGPWCGKVKYNYRTESLDRAYQRSQSFRHSSSLIFICVIPNKTQNKVRKKRMGNMFSLGALVFNEKQNKAKEVQQLPREPKKEQKSGVNTGLGKP
ncbi:hypothetical protein [Leptospira alexanderi]|uniref:hypothetical protein n=1 Tax=Leptospira alexanderi TaxID=100053 RepID=UPI001FD0AB4E|nr:hypothetical protein [Leptospira alexanderi]